MKLKHILTIGCCVLLLSGCGNAPEATTEETTEAESQDMLVSVADVSTECGFHYRDFLKLGSMTTDEIKAEYPEWTYTSDDSGESWYYETEENMYSYKRDLINQISNYTLSFAINAQIIDKWINQECDGLDRLLGVRHTRDVVEDAYWYFKWDEGIGDVQLKIVKTNDASTHVAILSMNRQGGTALDSSQVEVVKQ